MSPFTETEQLDLHTVCSLSGECTTGGVDTCVINGYDPLTPAHLGRLGELCLCVMRHTTDEPIIRIALHAIKAVSLRED